MYIKLFKLIGKLIHVYTLLFSYSLYYKIEDYFIVRDRDDIKEPMSDPSDFMGDDEWEGPGNPLPNGNYSEAEAADYSIREDEVLGDNWPHIAYSLHHQNKKEGNK